jgi:hypothetical protein
VIVRQNTGDILISATAAKMNQYNACAVTFIDYFANESTPTIIDLKKPFKIVYPNQPNENR